MKKKLLVKLFVDNRLLGIYDFVVACQIVNGMPSHGEMMFVGRCVFVDTKQ